MGEETMPKDCLTGHQGSPLHDDWWWPFDKISRAWTSFCRRYLWGLLDFSRPPSYLRGNLEAGLPEHFKLFDPEGAKIWYPNDIPPAGHWFIGWPPYWAWTQRTRDAKRLWRFGFRYTTTTKGPPTWAKTPEHNYYNFPAGPAIREISPDLAFALSRQQLRNHLLHGAVAAALIALLLSVDLPRWVVGLLAVATVALGKEYAEVMLRTRRSRPIHWWDGVLDAAGWLLFAILTILIWRWLT
jgi:hypothetical protein